MIFVCEFFQYIGSVAKITRNYINKDLKYVPWLTGYLAILFGCLVTILIQSSSVFTSILTPLAGLGYIKLERMYPLTLGSNLGTTTTSIIAALAADPSRLKYTLQIALCHFFFNFFGILLFYVIPQTRLPIRLAKGLGNITAKYRWFAIAYLVLMFLVLPFCVFLLSLGGTITVLSVGIPIMIVILFVVAVNWIRANYPTVLPEKLRSWKWLPIWLRSLEPYDRVIMRIFYLMPCCKKFGGGEKGADGTSSYPLPKGTSTAKFVEDTSFESLSKVPVTNPAFVCDESDSSSQQIRN
jgi:sodium-dependent phosphate cotransporter